MNVAFMVDYLESEPSRSSPLRLLSGFGFVCTEGHVPWRNINSAASSPLLADKDTLIRGAVRVDAAEFRVS